MCHHLIASPLAASLAPFEHMQATGVGAAQYLKALACFRCGAGSGGGDRRSRGSGGGGRRSVGVASQVTSMLIQFEGLTSTEYAHHQRATHSLFHELSDAASH